jgi:hypothetical protein
VTDDPDPLAAERLFFAALIAADLEGLDKVLADDFVLIDVIARRRDRQGRPGRRPGIGPGACIFSH